jgi:uncharacterized protein YoxC
MEGLGTTNILLGIMAGVSVLEGLLLIGLGIAAYRIYAQVTTLVSGLETRQVAPAMARVNAILDDVKAVSETVKDETTRVDTAIRTTMDRVDETADRLRSNVRARTGRLVGIVRGARVALEHMLTRAA